MEEETNTDERLTDFSKLPRGTEVWYYPTQEWVPVTDVSFATAYPVRIETSNYNKILLTKDGKFTEQDKMPVIFASEWRIPDEAFKQPLPTLRRGDKILVKKSKDDKTWIRRYFAKWSSMGDLLCFINGADTWTTNGDTVIYPYWKIPEK